MSYPKRMILENVPRVTTQDPAVQENFHFCACMRACMQYLGKDKSYDFIFFAGITGALFFNIWPHSTRWRYMEAITSGHEYKENDEMIKKAFISTGYDSKIIAKYEIKKNKDYYIREIIKSVNEGYPVLTYGIIGPPTCSLITGYDEDGDVLIGWSAFQGDPLPEGYEPCGYFRKRDGLTESEKLVFFGAKQTELPMHDIAVSALKNIKIAAEIAKTKDYVFGVDAYTSWAEALLDDSVFTQEKVDTFANIVDAHCGQKVIVMTGRTYAAQFLSQMLIHAPEYKNQIEKVITLCTEENNILNKFWQLEPQFYFDRQKLLDKEYRKQSASIILEARSIYSQMVTILKEL